MTIPRNLSSCMKKVNRVTFGVMTEEEIRRAELHGKLSDTRKKLAVPFVGKDVPSPAAEFAQPDVAIGLTCMACKSLPFHSSN